MQGIIVKMLEINRCVGTGRDLSPPDVNFNNGLFCEIRTGHDLSLQRI